MVKINYAHEWYLQGQSILPAVVTKESEWTYARQVVQLAWMSLCLHCAELAFFWRSLLLHEYFKSLGMLSYSQFISHWRRMSGWTILFFSTKIYKTWKTVLRVIQGHISNFVFIRRLIPSYIYRLQRHISVSKASRIVKLTARTQLTLMLQINGFKFTFRRK